MNRKIGIILGSGESIATLTKSDVDFINSAEYVIALNKFGAFEHLTELKPNVYYFHDILSYKFFVHMVSKLQSGSKSHVIFTNTAFSFLFRADSIAVRIEWLTKFLCRIVTGKLGRRAALAYLWTWANVGLLNHRAQDFDVVSFDVTKWNRGGRWAKSFGEPIYHFYGSLSSALNCMSIVNPNSDIYLVGCDFLGPRYFYQKELEASRVQWKDHTYEATQRTGRHASIQRGGEFDFRFGIPKIKRMLKDEGCEAFVCTKNSPITGDNLFEYRKLPKLK